jgi:hypothetical protein
VHAYGGLTCHHLASPCRLGYIRASCEEVKYGLLRRARAQLEGMDGREDHYDAKFTVLAENVRHHIKEEENEVFPKAKDAAIDFEALSNAMVQRKETLLAKGVPPAAEDAMVAASHGKGASPAQAAHKTKPRAAKSHAGRQAVPGA